mgnify:CR=1 FL=1
MRVLVVGSGGREHALVWKLSQSPKVEKMYCAPGNAGIAQMAECVNIKAEDLDGLLAFAVKQKIDLTVVGPEVPLTMGIVDKFNELNISYNKFDLTKTGELQIFSVDDFFYIWKQLINLVDKDIKVEIKSMKQFFSKCSGYGIYD